MAKICGGVGDDIPATEEVQELCEKVRDQIKEKMNGADLKEFKAIKHKTQVVAGTNFFVKIHVGDDQHVHARIYRDLQQNVSLHSIQANKGHEDAIEYF